MSKNLINTVHNLDVFDLIKKIDDNFLDLVVTDPPYGTGGTKGYGRSGKTIKNDEDESINYHFITAIYPKMKDNSVMYIFCNWRYIASIYIHAEKHGLKYKMLICMVKANIGMGNPFRNQHEFVIVLEKGSPEYNLKNFSNVIKMKHINHDADSHPHKKHPDVMRKIILHSSKPNDVVFDGFLGSFTSVISCIEEGRLYIGSELDKKYFDKGVKRINEYKSQTKLF